MGKFNAHQMLCHLQDQMSYALGIKKEDKERLKGPPMFIRHMLRLFLPWPKGKVQTLPSMLETQPEEWEKDKAKVLKLMDSFADVTEKAYWPHHPFSVH